MTAGRWMTLVLVAATACTNLRDRGDTLYKQRKFDEAASAYDQYLAGHPNDKAALEGRRRARNEQLRVHVRKVQRERVANLGRDAANELASLLSDRDAWHERLDPDLAAAIEFEVADAGARIGSEVAAQITSTGPLAGEAAANAYQALLDERDLATTRGAIHIQLTEAGRARCARLAPDDGPYTQWLVAAYCAHWGTPRLVPLLPEQRATLVVDGAIQGATAREVEALHAALATSFQRTAWFAATAAGTAHASLDGSLAVAESSEPVTLTASWTESVPYTQYETHQESYDEPYDDTETYTESVPSTEYRTETVPCGDTTCTNTVPETVYHDETKTRTVTKYRTAYRDVTVPVTYYRDEARSQNYNAIERSATYRSDLHVRVDQGLPLITAAVDESTSESGYDHDVTIAAAGVSPSRANLTTQADFASAQTTKLADSLASALDAHYRQQFCSAPAFSLDEASRCAYSDTTQVPEVARVALRPLLGAEADYLRLVQR